MWQSIGDAIKIFLEKHLIPTVIAVVSAIVALVVLPSDYWMITKVGKSLFFILVAGIVFLLIELLGVFWKFIKNSWLRAQGKIRHLQYAKEEEEETIEEFLSFVDKLPPEDRDLLMEFIKNENQPITKPCSMYVMRDSNSLYYTKALVSTKNRDGSTQTKLKDEFYQLAKYIYEKRGSISHF